MDSSSNIIQVLDLRVDGLGGETMSRLASGIVVGTGTPVFSWRLSAGRQRACRVAVASTAEKLASPDLWDSGWLETANSLAVLYGGKPLESRQHAWLQAFVELEDGRRGISEAVPFTIGLLNPSDWYGKWIYADGFEHLTLTPVPCFRREFALRKAPLKQALLFCTAKGLLEVTLNGRRVDEHDFLPGWTDFRQEVQYTAYDVTGFLQEGTNTLATLLGDGWHTASFPAGQRALYGLFPLMKMQLELLYEDGETEVVATDGSWRWRYGDILGSDLYDGEFCNAMREMPGWRLNGFDDSGWRPALEQAEADADAPRLVRKLMPGVRRGEPVAPVSRRVVVDGVWLYDFGRNMTARVRLRFKAPFNASTLRGRLRYAEVLNPDGTLYNVNFHSADNIDSYIVKAGENDWETHFTFRCFRYVQLEILPIEGFGLEDIRMEAIPLTSDLEPTGTFECGFEPLNRLSENIVTSMQSNLLEVPMDCPQRCERLGWTGDDHFFFPTAMFLADGRGFYRKHMQDLRGTQREDGNLCAVAPAVPSFIYGSIGWVDALPIIAWGLYRRGGDIRLVQENYGAVKRYLAYQEAHAENFLLLGHSDHLALTDKPADPRLIGTAYFHNCAVTAAAMAAVLGLEDEASAHRALAGRVRHAFRKAFLTAEGLLKEPTQTGFALLFHFGLLDTEAEKKANGERFAALIRANGNKLDTGFVGTAYLCTALAQAGQAKTACDLVLQREFPSWLFEVDNGATSVWERWDSYHPERGFGNPIMNSFNHCANGAVGEFLYAWLAGLDFEATDENGEVAPRVRFHIVPDARIGFARATLMTPCGEAASEWRLEGEKVRWRCRVPPNAVGDLPEYGLCGLEPGEHEFVLHNDGV